MRSHKDTINSSRLTPAEVTQFFDEKTPLQKIDMIIDIALSAKQGEDIRDRVYDIATPLRKDLLKMENAK